MVTFIVNMTHNVYTLDDISNGTTIYYIFENKTFIKPFICLDQSFYFEGADPI